MIKIVDLNKKYKKAASFALQDINLEINQGMYGLLGANGAGKTTLINILTTMSPKTSGEILMNDIPYKSSNYPIIRKAIGYVPQEFGMFPNMSIAEIMDYFRILNSIPQPEGTERISNLLGYLNLKQPLFIISVLVIVFDSLHISSALFNMPYESKAQYEQKLGYIKQEDFINMSFEEFDLLYFEAFGEHMEQDHLFLTYHDNMSVDQRTMLGYYKSKTPEEYNTYFGEMVDGEYIQEVQSYTFSELKNLLFLSILFYVYIVKITEYKFSTDYFYSFDDIGFFEAVLVVGGISFLHIGLVAATFANKMKNVYAGIIVGYIYSTVWIGLSSLFQNVLLNPYPYASYSDNIFGSKLLIMLVNAVLIMYNYHICNQSLYVIE